MCTLWIKLSFSFPKHPFLFSSVFYILFNMFYLMDQSTHPLYLLYLGWGCGSWRCFWFRLLQIIYRWNGLAEQDHIEPLFHSKASIVDKNVLLLTYIYLLCWHIVLIICIVSYSLGLVLYWVEIPTRGANEIKPHLISIILVLRVRFKNDTSAVFTVPNYIVLIWM